jgi:23S rRNA-/tRNA-specific pseudouridylate synthase
MFKKGIAADAFKSRHANISRKGLIRINRRPAHSEVMVKSEDFIQIYGGEEYTETLTPEPLPIEIIYEDAQLLNDG